MQSSMLNRLLRRHKQNLQRCATFLLIISILNIKLQRAMDLAHNAPYLPPTAQLVSQLLSCDQIKHLKAVTPNVPEASTFRVEPTYAAVLVLFLSVFDDLLACSSNCSTCSGPSSTQCLTCNAGLLYDTPTTSCLSQCPSGSFYNTVDVACESNRTIFRFVEYLSFFRMHRHMRSMLNYRNYLYFLRRIIIFILKYLRCCLP